MTSNYDAWYEKKAFALMVWSILNNNTFPQKKWQKKNKVDYISSKNIIKIEIQALAIV